MAQSVTAYLSVDDAAAAVVFYRTAFGATDVGPTLRAPDGAVLHAEIRLGDSAIFLAEASADPAGASPLTLGNTPVRLALEVPDVDGFCDRAAAQGAEVLIQPSDQFYGFRSARLRDPFGHLWVVSTRLEDLTEMEMQARLDAMMSGQD